MTKGKLIELVKFTAGEIAQPTNLNNEDAESIVDDFLKAEQCEHLFCDVCGSDDVIEAPSMGRNCNNCHPL